MRKAKENDNMNMPHKKFIAGAVSATIWQNAGKKDGREYEYSSLSLERTYKDKDGKWQNTGSLRVTDLPKEVVVLSKAYEYLVLRDQAKAQ